MKMLAAFSIPAILGLALLWLLMKGDEYRCSQAWKDSGYETRLNFGCQVHVDGRWVPADSVKIIAQAR